MSLHLGSGCSCALAHLTSCVRMNQSFSVQLALLRRHRRIAASPAAARRFSVSPVDPAPPGPEVTSCAVHFGRLRPRTVDPGRLLEQISVSWNHLFSIIASGLRCRVDHVTSVQMSGHSVISSNGNNFLLIKRKPGRSAGEEGTLTFPKLRWAS